MKKLHPNQQKLLTLLRKHQENPLTMEELAQEMDISSKSVVYYHLTQLEKKGCITRSAVNPQQYFIKDEQEKAVAYLPLYGMAKCGPAGTLLDGNPSRVVPVDPFERRWRDETGLLYQFLARESAIVDRVWAGLAVRLKG